MSLGDITFELELEGGYGSQYEKGHPSTNEISPANGSSGSANGHTQPYVMAKDVTRRRSDRVQSETHKNSGSASDSSSASASSATTNKKTDTPLADSNGGKSDSTETSTSNLSNSTTKLIDSSDNSNGKSNGTKTNSGNINNNNTSSKKSLETLASTSIGSNVTGSYITGSYITGSKITGSKITGSNITGLNITNGPKTDPSSRPSNVPLSSFPSTNTPTSNAPTKGRLRSNSQSQSISMPSLPKASPIRRTQEQYYVTLTPLNDTFTKKHLPVANLPETTKLGRPTGAKHKPDVTNGYFDSRVLSRNHAQIFIDPATGKLMLEDLGSSNGTYLNDVRLARTPVEIVIGDVVCLGFNVQVDSTHKQISLKVENINVISNTGKTLFGSRGAGVDSTEFKHLRFIEEIYKQVNIGERPEEELISGDRSLALLKRGSGPREPTQKQKEDSGYGTFSDSLFSDINPSLEQSLLHYSSNSGIYNNSQITNTTTLENIVTTLTTTLSRAKLQNNYLSSLETFFKNYHANLDDINGKYLDHEFKKSVTDLQNDLKRFKTSTQKLKDRMKMSETEAGRKIDSLAMKLKETEKEKTLLSEKLQIIEDQKRLEQSKEKAIKETETETESEMESENMESKNIINNIMEEPENQTELTESKETNSKNGDSPVNSHPFEETPASVKNDPVPTFQHNVTKFDPIDLDLQQEAAIDILELFGEKSEDLIRTSENKSVKEIVSDKIEENTKEIDNTEETNKTNENANEKFNEHTDKPDDSDICNIFNEIPFSGNSDHAKFSESPTKITTSTTRNTDNATKSIPNNTATNYTNHTDASTTFTTINTPPSSEPEHSDDENHEKFGPTSPARSLLTKEQNYILTDQRTMAMVVGALLIGYFFQRVADSLVSS
jgi:pSer/pThr/pTyr-binding forkhead associated (FHA) protein